MANTASKTRQAESTAAAEKSDGELWVYCKGCGTPLETRARLSKPKPVVERMMCEVCTERHGHPLMPQPGAETFCYRCGTREDTFVAPGISPTTHHVCPNCLPDRHKRFAVGNFEDPVPEPEPAEEAKT